MGRKRKADEATEGHPTDEHVETHPEVEHQTEGANDFNTAELDRQNQEHRQHHEHREHIPPTEHQPHREHGQTHAETVGKKVFQAPPDPFGIAGDYIAGVRLLESRKYHVMILKFEEKPSPEVIVKIKDAGFRWNAPEKAWVHNVTRDNAMTARINAETLFNEVAGMIRQERGINHGFGTPG